VPWREVPGGRYRLAFRYEQPFVVPARARKCGGRLVDDNVLEELSPTTSNPALGERVLPWAAIGRAERLHASST
jgi:hypothetical protein